MSAVKRIGVAVGCGLLLATLLPATTASAVCYVNTRAEKSFARKINLARSAAGRNRLRLDPELSKAAKVHSREMVSRETLYHTPTNTLKRRVTRWTTLGENVGVGGTVTTLHTAFMGSSAHRANILYSSFRHVGVGTKRAGGRLWVTVIFEARTDPGSPLCN
ncbi:MAG: CAP domain-containing protein [Actinomycetota bacterium]